MLEIPDGLDPWDPNNWRPSTHEYRIYADESLEVYAVVDAKYYPILCRYKWAIHDKRKHERGFTYLRRTTAVFHGPDGEPYESEYTGKLVRNRKRTVSTRFLHTDVLILSGKPQPSPKHKEADHLDRNTLNCTEDNLIWATRLMQVKNSHRAAASLANLKLWHRRRGRTSTSTTP